MLASGAARKEAAEFLLIGKLVADEVENIFRKFDNHIHERMRSEIYVILFRLLIEDSNNIYARSADKERVTSLRRDRVRAQINRPMRTCRS